MSVASLSASAEEEVVDRNTVSDESIAQEGEGPPNAVWVMEPIEDAGTAEGEFVEDIADTLPSMDTDDLLEDAQSVLLEEDITPYSLNDLQIVNMDELSETPKYAAVYDARAVSGWQKENGYWYYYKNGVRATGWLLLNDSGTDHYYYLDPAASGRMVTGLKTITSDGKAHKYYFTSDGPMAHGWYRLQLPGDSGYFYYYFGIPERPLTGYMRVSEWLEDTESSPIYWYYLGSDGHMYSYKWLYYNGEWFYFVGDGHMLTSTFYTISGELYYFSDSGAVKTGWFKIGTDTYRATSTGVLSRGTVQLSEYVSSTFDSSGKWLSDTMIEKTSDIHGYPFNARVKDWVIVDGQRRGFARVCGNELEELFPGITQNLVSYYNLYSEGLVTLQKTVTYSSATIQFKLRSTDPVLPEWVYARTYSKNASGNWLAGSRPSSGSIEDGSFNTGEIVFSEIHFNPENVNAALAEDIQRYLSRHEVGHALGLRHTYEGEAEVPTIALMHPYVYNSNRRSTFQDYDYVELRKTFPQ